MATSGYIALDAGLVLGLVSGPCGALASEHPEMLLGLASEGIWCRRAVMCVLYYGSSGRVLVAATYLCCMTSGSRGTEQPAFMARLASRLVGNSGRQCHYPVTLLSTGLTVVASRMGRAFTYFTEIHPCCSAEGEGFAHAGPCVSVYHAMARQV